MNKQVDSAKSKKDTKTVRFTPVKSEEQLRVSAATILFSKC